MQSELEYHKGSRKMKLKAVFTLLGMLGGIFIAGGAMPTPAQASHTVQLQVVLVNVHLKGRKRMSQLPVTIYLQPAKVKRGSETVCRLSPRIRDALLGFFTKHKYVMTNRSKIDVKRIQKEVTPVVMKSLGRYQRLVKGVVLQQGTPSVSGSAASMFNRQGCMTAPHQDEIDRKKKELDAKNRAAKQGNKKKK